MPEDIPGTGPLAAGLRRWTRDHDTHVRAAVELLISQDVWLRRPEFVTACVGTSGHETFINWRHAETFALSAPGSTTEVAVLRIAIAIGSNQYRLSRLNYEQAAMVAAAFTDALGM